MGNLSFDIKKIEIKAATAIRLADVIQDVLVDEKILKKKIPAEHIARVSLLPDYIIINTAEELK